MSAFGDDIKKDIKGLYRKIRFIAIDYITSHEFGIKGPVSNTKLREWGYYSLKRAKMERDH